MNDLTLNLATSKTFNAVADDTTGHKGDLLASLKKKKDIFITLVNIYGP